MPHLFVDISSHGFGHLAQAAPVLNRLAGRLPALQLTIRCGLPLARLQQRIHVPFHHLPDPSDFGYVMRDAVTLDLPATAAAYRAAHADFPARVAAEARLLRQREVDAVFSDVAYLPLAGAAQAGIPAIALCSLNWADLFQHYFGGEDWAAPIHAEILAAYRTARFLRATPGMPMTALDDCVAIGPIGSLGQPRRSELRGKVGAGGTAKLVMVAMGGIPHRLPVEAWPALPNTHWLVPAEWNVQRPDCTALEALAWPFVDLLHSVDVVITKPGYGTFAEAAGNGTAVLYQRRDDWPEQEHLIAWLQDHARCEAVTAAQLDSGDLGSAIEKVMAAAVPPAPTFSGIDQAADEIAGMLGVSLA